MYRLLVLFTVLISTNFAAPQIEPLEPQDSTRQRDQGQPNTLAGLVDPEGLSSFMDPLISKYIERADYPGVVAVVVAGDRVFWQQGYGWTDATKSTEVSADQTVFLAASLSKLFVATAVMQLVETGRLRLDEDIRPHLKGLSLVPPLEKPLTLKHLLTHTGGLDEFKIGIDESRSKEPTSLKAYFQKYPPRSVYEPGTQINYSNRGMCLAAYVVEVVSGRSFEDYVSTEVLERLGMQDSSFAQPVPPQLRKRMAMERFTKSRIITYPVSSLATTGSDMARFMIAHLNQGLYDNRVLLTPETLAVMHATGFRAHERMPGAALGFFESMVNGRRVLFHSGARDHFSFLMLMPEEKVGLFLVMSGDHGDANLRQKIATAFLERYFPPEAPFALPGEPSERSRPDSYYNGIYRLNMLSRGSIEKLAALPSDHRVVPGENGGLLMGNLLGGKPVRMVETEPGLFRSQDGSYYSFYSPSAQSVPHLAVSRPLKDPISLEKIAWYKSGPIHLLVGAVGYLFLAVFLAGSCLLFLVRRLKRKSSRDHSGTWAFGVVTVAFVVLAPVVGVLMLTLKSDRQLHTAIPVFYVMLSMILVACVGGLILPFRAFAAWKGRYWSLKARIVFTFVAVASFLMIPYFHYWNLLGFRF